MKRRQNGYNLGEARYETSSLMSTESAGLSGLDKLREFLEIIAAKSESAFLFLVYNGPPSNSLQMGIALATMKPSVNF